MADRVTQYKANPSTFVERPDIAHDPSWLAANPEHAARYLYATQFVEGRSVLDAGTGPGYGAAILREAGATEVQAVDLDARSIAAASQRYPRSGLRFFVDDCEKLDKVIGPVDVVCSFENIEHLQHPERFLRAATSILDPAGVLLVSSPDRGGACPDWVDGRPANPYHLMEWYRDEFLDFLGEFFGTIELRTQVIAHAAIVRRRAVQNLKHHLTYLWGNPIARIMRLMGRASGNSQNWPSIEGLSATSVYDYPIVTESAVSAVGEALCHYAICTNPRR